MNIDIVDISDHVVEKFLNARVRFAVIIMLMACAFITARLYYLQILKGSKYVELSINNRIRVSTIAAPRGIVFSKKGRVLASNNPSFDLCLIPQDTADASELLKTVSSMLNLDVAPLKKKVAGQRGRPPFEPITLKKELSWEEMSLVLTKKMDLQGITIDVIPKRVYTAEGFAPHVLGFLGEIDRAEMVKHPHGEYAPGDLIGKFGLEKWGERHLRGEKGGLQTEVDAHGNRQKILAEIDPRGGCNLVVSLDIDIQKTAEELLKDKVGAVVAMRPDTGEIIALASTPGFNADLFSRGIDHGEWEKLVNNPMHPLLNRAIQTQQPPGSVFKIVTAIAALEEKAVDPEERIFCPGYYSLGSTTFGCWKKGGHGTVNLYEAIVRSCDTYFYTVGQRLGIDAIHEYATMFGLGHKTGIELEGEKAGLIPSQGWKKKRFGIPWQKGETLNTAIGQGFVLTTPLQIACFFCGIANETFIPRPHLVEAVHCDTEQAATVFEKEVLREFRVSPRTLSLIKEGLMGVVHDPTGTATRMRIEGLTIGGKTGTAQVVSKRLVPQKEEFVPWQYKDHAWFACMAPMEKPEIVVSVFLEHGGHGGSAAAPIAREVVAAYLKPEALKKASSGSAVKAAPEDNETQQD